MRRACVYFGTEVPERSWSMGLDRIDVVLQPYHPLARYGGYTERFPNARRYLYVNPTSVDPWVLERSDPKPPITAWDARWSLPRLDLWTAAGMDFAVRTAVETLALDGGGAQGLFVDDLDRLLPDDADIAMRYLERVQREADREVRWFVNRAFEVWPRVGALDAVLLEDMAPSVTRHAPVDEVRWVRSHVLPAVDAVRARGVSVHAVSYADQEGLHPTAPDLVLERELGSRIDSVLTGIDRTVSTWKVYA